MDGAGPSLREALAAHRFTIAGGEGDPGGAEAFLRAILAHRAGPAPTPRVPRIAMLRGARPWNEIFDSLAASGVVVEDAGVGATHRAARFAGLTVDFRIKRNEATLAAVGCDQVACVGTVEGRRCDGDGAAIAVVGGAEGAAAMVATIRDRLHLVGGPTQVRLTPCEGGDPPTLSAMRSGPGRMLRSHPLRDRILTHALLAAAPWKMPGRRGTIALDLAPPASATLAAALFGSREAVVARLRAHLRRTGAGEDLLATADEGPPPKPRTIVVEMPFP